MNAVEPDFERAVSALSDAAAFKTAVATRLGGDPLLHRDPSRVAEAAAKKLNKLAMRGKFGSPAFVAIKEIHEAARRRCQNVRRP